MRVCDFEGATPIGRPRDWDPELDGECGTVYAVDQVDTRTGLNFKYTVYQPTAEELEVLNAGGVLRLGIACQVHPVINMVLLGPRFVEECGIQPKWDMGSPVLEPRDG